jgi:hypothetical protein
MKIWPQVFPFKLLTRLVEEWGYLGKCSRGPLMESSMRRPISLASSSWYILTTFSWGMSSFSYFFSRRFWEPSLPSGDGHCNEIFVEQPLNNHANLRWQIKHSSKVNITNSIWAESLLRNWQLLSWPRNCPTFYKAINFITVSTTACQQNIYPEAVESSTHLDSLILLRDSSS